VSISGNIISPTFQLLPWSVEYKLAVAKQSSLARCHDAGYSEIGIITVSLFNYRTIVSFRLIFLIIYIKKTISYTNIAIFFTHIAFFSKVWYTVKKRGKKMSSLIYRQSGRDIMQMVWLEDLVPKEHLLRKIDAAIDFNKIYEKGHNNGKEKSFTYWRFYKNGVR
jgi:hypothetical protein